MQKYNQIDTQESFKRGPRAFFVVYDAFIT